MITSERDVFIGAHFSQAQKDRFKAEAERRKMSMSALLSLVVSQWLGKAEEEQLPAIRSNKRGPNGERIIDGMREIPLPLEGE